MPKYKVFMDGYKEWVVKAEHVAYEGNNIIFYNNTPYDPKVVIRREAHVVKEDTDDGLD